MYIKEISKARCSLLDGIFHDEDWVCVWATNHGATHSHTLINRRG